MHIPYVYSGDPRDYDFGHAEDGAIAYFQGRPPDGNWTPHVPLAADDVAPIGGVDDQGGDLKQPNKAAPADDWRLFADQHGGFEEATGKSPLDPTTTRKEIVDHYAAGQSEGDPS